MQSPERLAHACVVVGSGKRQMLSSGGVSDETSWRSTDEWDNGLGILDLTELEWRSSFSEDEMEYESPEAVKEWYNKG